MKKSKLVVVGGFLGAGKTTSILALARHYLALGKRIGIVTNDQGSNLVDTEFLRQEGFPVLEVAGGCFCCNFDEFTEKVNQLAADEMPDLILAEPVGSCTDLIATIFKPMQQKYTGQFAMMPLSVIADPRRVQKIMMEDQSKFANEINYLFQKQLEEADVILLNKIDLLDADTISQIESFLTKRFPGIPVLGISAKNGMGIPIWAAEITEEPAAQKCGLEIDYDRYGAAEEYLGWLNSRVTLSSGSSMDVNRFMEDFMCRLRSELKTQNHEIAHLKLYSICENDWAKASITSLEDTLDFSRRMELPAKQFNLIINARMQIEPAAQKTLVESLLEILTEEHGLTLHDMETECFKPNRPKKGGNCGCGCNCAG